MTEKHFYQKDLNKSASQPEHSPPSRPLKYEQIHRGKPEQQGAHLTGQQRIQELVERSGAYGTPGYRGPLHTKFYDDGPEKTIPGKQASLGVIDTYRHLHNTMRLPELENKQDYAIEDSWKTKKAREKIKAAIEEVKGKVGHDRFYVVHHTFPKGPLADFYDELTNSQREKLATTLDVDLNEGRWWVLANLYSNLSLGPPKGERRNDPGTD